MYDKVYLWDVLEEAWRRVKANKGAAGIDKQTLSDIEEMGVEKFLLTCRQNLKENNYRPMPLLRQENKETPYKRVASSGCDVKTA